MPFGAFPAEQRRRVVVTGLGAVTPLGHTVAATWTALCKGISGTRSLAEVPFFFPSCIDADRRLSEEAKLKCREQILAAMPCQVAAAVMPTINTGGGSNNNNNNNTFAPTSRETRATLFTHHAVEEALIHAGIIIEADGKRFHAPCAMERFGVNLGVGMPSIADVSDIAYNLYADPSRVHYSRVNPFFVPKILGNTPAGLTAIRYGITGPVGSGVAACATGAECVAEAATWIRSGRADIVICGAAEACVTPVAIAGFSRMRALCTKFNHRPHAASRPFDAARGGFVMGEGCGVLILEAEEHAKRRGATAFAELRGVGLASDAHDIAAPHPQGRGAQLCLQTALRDSGGVPGEAVGYVNAHATGTIGDDIELRALDAVLGHSHNNNNSNNNSGSTASNDNDNKRERRTPLCVSSVKGALGHLLGAAGSVEAIVAIKALYHQLAPPNVNLETASTTDIDRIILPKGQTPHKFSGEAVISTSFGFGGVNTALLFTQRDTVSEGNEKAD